MPLTDDELLDDGDDLSLASSHAGGERSSSPPPPTRAQWVELLRAYNERKDAEAAAAGGGGAGSQQQSASVSAAEAERAVQEELRRIYREEAARRRAARKEAQARASNSDSKQESSLSAQIPRFYIPRCTTPPPVDSGGEVDASSSSLASQLRREARTRYLERRAEQLLDERELALLWETIQMHSVDATATATAAGAGGVDGAEAAAAAPVAIPGVPAGVFDVEKRLNYDSFLLISHSLPPSKAARYFKPSLFLSFPQDGQGRISSRALWRYLTRKVQLTRLRISLTCYDDVGYGYLREQDLENYVYDQLASLPPLASLERDFYPYYVFTAVRKFIFLLDPSRRGKLRIKHLVESGVMSEFDSLRFPHGHGQGGATAGPAGSVGSAPSKKNAWFSAAHTQEVYAVYLGLDTNQNGMLSRDEFRHWNGGNLTAIFVDGLFAEYRMYPSSGEGDDVSSGSGAGGGVAANELEMDYKTFLDFVLAMEYKTSPASIAYFFRVLDCKHQGYLDAPTIKYWFRAVSERMAQLGHESTDITDVVADEIFDMVSPAVAGRITLNDLISSRCGHTVISMLIDVNGFWKYDNRESLMHSEEEN